MDTDNKKNGDESGFADPCQKERDEYLAGWQRAKADLLNYKKDEARRLEEIAKYQLADLFAELLTVLDNFDLAIASLEKQGPVEKGIYMIRTQIEDKLKRRGLVRISIQAGEPFDPAVAEAIAETESDLPAGTIVEEIEPGYRLHEKILRPARVRLAKPRGDNQSNNQKMKVE